jgi:hypothetical protein
MKRIVEMQKDFNHRLQQLVPGATWGHYQQTEQGCKIIRGEHVTVRVPKGVEVRPKSVEGLFNVYYDDVTMVYCKEHNVNGEDITEVMLEVDSDERNEKIRSGEEVAFSRA